MLWKIRKDFFTIIQPQAPYYLLIWQVIKQFCLYLLFGFVVSLNLVCMWCLLFIWYTCLYLSFT
jgi:hypothetical protein